MKTALFLCYYQSAYGGNFIPSLMALEKEIQKRNACCIYAFPEKAKEREWYRQLCGGSTVLTLDFNQDKMGFISTLKRTIEKYSIDIIYSHFGKALEVELIALFNRNIKGVIHIHSDFSMGRLSCKERIIQYIIYRLLSGNTQFISVSKDFVKYNPHKIKYIPNALASNRIQCKHIGGSEIRRRFHVAKNEILCTVFGWSPDVKGVDIAVNAVGKLKKQGYKEIKLMIVCGNVVAEQQMQQYISKKTSYNGHEDFLIYAEPTEDVFSYHEAADVLLVTSRSEGFSYTLLEMLSIGKRCVISDIPGVRWAKKYSCVYPFAVGDANQCGEEIIQALKQHYNVEQIKKIINSEYSIDKWSDEVADILVDNDSK